MAGTNAIGNDYSWMFNSATNNTKKKDSIAKMWDNYYSAQANATSSLSGLTEINANLKSLIASYEEAKSAFNTELGENMDALSDSAAKVKNYNFNVAKEGAITKTHTTDKDGKVTEMTTYSKDLQDALDNVQNFVNDYNTAINFFKDNSSISKRIENMANTFGDTTFRASNYEQIGLMVSSDGSISIDENKLANAILESPEKVSRTLDGLASKAEEHIAFAEGQADKLFPTLEAMFGDQISAASLYTGEAYRKMVAYANNGNLFNMML